MTKAELTAIDRITKGLSDESLVRKLIRDYRYLKRKLGAEKKKE